MLVRFGVAKGAAAKAHTGNAAEGRGKKRVWECGQGQGKGVSSESSAVISSQLTIAHKMPPFRLSFAVAAELRYGSARVGRRSSTPKTRTKRTRS